MKLVAVSQRIDIHPERNEYRDAIDQRLMEFIIEADYLPIAVPNNLDQKVWTWMDTLTPDAVILSGGNDMPIPTFSVTVANPLLFLT